MKLKFAALVIFSLLASSPALSQKVKVGFDKSVDFSKYRSYSWVNIGPANEMPMRKLLVMIEVDGELKKKGLQRLEEGGDLLISGSGGFGGSVGGEHLGTIVPTATSGLYPYTGIWTGAPYAPGNTNVEGALALDFVDRSSNRLVWQGSVASKLDTDNRQKLINRIREAVMKLLDRYPPATK